MKLHLEKYIARWPGHLSYFTRTRERERKNKRLGSFLLTPGQAECRTLKRQRGDLVVHLILMMMNDDDDDNDPIFFFLFLSFLARPDGPFDFGRIESDGQNWVKNLFFFFFLINKFERKYL